MNKRIAGISIIVAGVAVAVLTLPVGDWLRAFNNWVAEIGPLGILVFIGVYVCATVLFLPGSILTVGAGAAFGLLWGFVAVSAGSTIGAACAFLVSRYAARDYVRSLAGRNRNFAAVDQAIAEEGWKIVGLLRLSPLLPFNASNYLYGLTGVKFWPYVVASWIGMMPGTVMYVYFGVVGKQTLEVASGGMSGNAAKYAFTVIGLLATIAVSVLITKKARAAIAKYGVDDSPGSEIAEDTSGNLVPKH